MPPKHSAGHFYCDCAQCMRGGRTEPREVSKTTYNAHAKERGERHQLSSYSAFIEQQEHLQPVNLRSPGAMSSGTRRRARSPSPTPPPVNKCPRRYRPNEDFGSVISQEGDDLFVEPVAQSEEGEMDWNVEDREPLFRPPLGVDYDDIYVCRNQ
jgi:hypothetical protein